MYLVCRREGEDEQRWVFDPKKIRSGEAEQIEKVTDWDFSEFGMHLIKGSVLARRALLWTYLRRAHPVLKFKDVDFAVGEVELEYDKDELSKMRDEFESAALGTEAERTQQLALLDRQIAEAPEAPGKASSNSAG